jgi:hypothetical protein
MQMMPNHHSGARDAGTVGELSQHISEQLPVYATAIVFGSAGEMQYPAVARHIAACATCQAELDQLVELLRSAFDGQLEPAERYPHADLTFLEMPMQKPQPALPLWQLDAGRLVIRFPDLLHVPARQQLAGLARGGSGQLIYRYRQEPGSVADLDVSIEVYADDAAQTQGRVRVGVDVPSRGPLDQTGSLVTLHAGDANWQGETDESGCVDFAHVPLAALPQLRVEITPLREIEN